MPQVPLEMRVAKRVPLATTIHIRKPSEPAKENGDGEVVNVSMSGIYFKPHPEKSFQVGDTVLCMVSIGPEHRRNFPFVRIAGKGRVVRIDHQKSHPTVALSFAQDITLLAACP